MFSPTTLEMARQYRSEQICAAEQSRLAAQFKSYRMRRAVGALSTRILSRRHAFALVRVPARETQLRVADTRGPSPLRH